MLAGSSSPSAVRGAKGDIQSRRASSDAAGSLPPAWKPAWGGTAFPCRIAPIVIDRPSGPPNVAGAALATAGFVNNQSRRKVLIRFSETWLRLHNPHGIRRFTANEMARFGTPEKMHNREARKE